MIGAKSISLCMVVYNDAEGTSRAIKSVPFVDEVIIIDQGSDEKNANALKDMAHIYHRTTNKGNADYDRQFLYSLARKDFIFALDSDEYFEEEEINKFKNYVSKYDFDVVWFLFKNLVRSNGTVINLQDLLGDDPHPRFWRKQIVRNEVSGPTIIWPHEAHKFPTFNSDAQGFLNVFITHDRVLEGIVSRHLMRGKNIDGRAQEVEREFIKKLLEKFDEKTKSDLQGKFPELKSYLKGTTNG